MASEEDVSVRFGAQVDEALRGIDEINRRLTDFSKSHTRPVEDLNKALKGTREAVEAISLVMAGGVFKEWLSGANRAIEESMQLAQRLGVTTEEASKLRAALGNFGMNAESFLGIIQQMNRQIRSNEEAYRALGISTRNVSGDFRDQQSILFDVIEKLQGYKAGTDRNNAAAVLLGGRISDLTSLMRFNRQALAEGAEQAERLGLVFGDDAVSGMLRYKQAVSDAEDVTLAIKVRIAQELQPTLVGLANWLKGDGAGAIEAFGWATRHLMIGITALTTGIKLLVNEFNRMKDVSASAAINLTVGIESAIAKMRGKPMPQGGIDLNEVKAKYDAQADEIARKGKNAVNAIMGLDENGKPLKLPQMNLPATGEENFPGYDQSAQLTRLEKWKEQLTQQLMAEQNFFADSTRAELDFWQGKLEIQGLTAKERLAIEQQVYSLQKQMAQTDLNDYIASIRAKQEADRENYHAVMALQNELLATLARTYGEDSAQYQQALREKARMEREHLREVSISGREVFDVMTNSFGSMVQGILQGTQTWQQAWRRMFSNILISFLNLVQQKAMAWIWSEVIQTEATVAGDAARTASNQTAQATSNMGLFEQTISAIIADAQAVFSGIFAFLAPEMGPAAAGPAVAGQATVLATAAAVPSYDIGAWEIPKDHLAKVHGGEMILPKPFAESLRDNGGFGGGGTVNLHVHAIDAAGVKKFFMDNGSAVAAALGNQMRNFNPNTPSWKGA